LALIMDILPTEYWLCADFLEWHFPAINANCQYGLFITMADHGWNGNPYTWNTYTYPAMGLLQSNTNANTATNVRFVTFGVTEVTGTSTKVDWV
jgi:hypothetical protein